MKLTVRKVVGQLWEETATILEAAQSTDDVTPPVVWATINTLFIGTSEFFYDRLEEVLDEEIEVPDNWLEDGTAGMDKVRELALSELLHAGGVQ